MDITELPSLASFIIVDWSHRVLSNFISYFQLGNTALHCAVQYGHLPVVSRLLDKGADFNAMGVSLCFEI
jgi:Ankyrin repeat